MKISKAEFHSPELLCHCYMLILPRVSGKAGAGERAKFYVVLTRINYIKERERDPSILFQIALQVTMVNCPCCLSYLLL